MGAEAYFDQFLDEYKDDPVYQTEGLTLDAGIEIRKAMSSKGITQEELARRLGISQPAVAKYLNHNQNLTLSTMARISSALGLEWKVSLVEHRVPLSQARTQSDCSGLPIAAEEAAVYSTAAAASKKKRGT